MTGQEQVGIAGSDRNMSRQEGVGDLPSMLLSSRRCRDDGGLFNTLADGGEPFDKGRRFV